MASPDEKIRRQVAQMGAAAQRAKHDPRDTTLKARTAARERFLTEVDPHGTLRVTNPREAALRAKAAETLHMRRMAFESAKRRAERKASSEAGKGEAAA